METYDAVGTSALGRFGLDLPSMGIYWKGFNELDVYTSTDVKTLRGEDARVVTEILKNMSIKVEIVD